LASLLDSVLSLLRQKSVSVGKQDMWSSETIVRVHAGVYIEDVESREIFECP